MEGFETDVNTQGIDPIAGPSPVDEPAVSDPVDSDNLEEGGDKTDPIDETDSGAAPDSDPVQGLTEGIQAEREQRQKAEAEARFYRELAERQMTAPSVREEKPVDPYAGYDPEDYLPAGEAIKLTQQAIRQEMDPVKEQMRQGEIARQVEHAKATYQDYESTIQLGLDVAGKMGLKESQIMDMPNPAEYMYRLGRSHDDYIDTKIKSATQQATKKTVDTIQGNLNAPRTLSDASGKNSSVKDNANRIANMSREEFEKEFPEANW